MDRLKKDVGRFFDGDAKEYLAHKYSGGDAHSYMALRRLKAARLLQQYIAPGFNDQFRIVDCGCGPGILIDVLAPHRISYTGLDLSAEMLNLAKGQPANGESRLLRKNLVRGDVESIPFRTASFDAAASFGVIEYLETDERLIAELSRIVKPQGLLLIAVTSRSSYNLLLEKPLNFLRRRRAAVIVLDLIKRGVGRGRFRQAEFTKRRHAPVAFDATLRAHGFEPLESARWGFNVLPHPLNYICSNRMNAYANRWYERSASPAVRELAEGYMVLCRRT